MTAGVMKLARVLHWRESRGSIHLSKCGTVEGCIAETINITPYYTYNAMRHARFAANSQHEPFLLRRWLVIQLFPVGFVHPWLFDDAFLIE